LGTRASALILTPCQRQPEVKINANMLMCGCAGRNCINSGSRLRRLKESCQFTGHTYRGGWGQIYGSTLKTETVERRIFAERDSAKFALHCLACCEKWFDSVRNWLRRWGHSGL